jgi:hypothetical protein
MSTMSALRVRPIAGLCRVASSMTITSMGCVGVRGSAGVDAVERDRVVDGGRAGRPGGRVGGRVPAVVDGDRALAEHG